MPDNVLFTPNFQAAEDLSNDENRFVVLSSSGTIRRPNAIGEKALGVLIDDSVDLAGKGGSVAMHGIAEVVAGETLVIGDVVGPEYISAADAGKAVKSQLSGGNARGICLSGGAEDEIVEIFLFEGGAGGTVIMSFPLPAGTANQTDRNALMSVGRAMKITRCTISAQTIPIDADGTLLLALINYDASAPAEDALLAASFNLEGLATAKAAEDMALTATLADLVLAAGDSLVADIISDSVGIDTPMVGASITIEADLL